MSNIKLSNIFEIEHFMKILIDEFIDVDADGNFLINVGYGRVSTDRQAELGYGLDIQEKEILNYAKNNGYKNLVLFIDDGYTGTNMDRPALQAIIKMITDFNEGKSNIRINTMIIPKIDRLGRTLLGTLQFIQDYIVSAKSENNKSRINKNREDINFVSVAENYCRIERNNPQGKFLLMLFASLAEFDRDLIVEKLQKGRISRVASGKWMGGGITPYGYIYDRDSGLLKIVPEEAEKIKEAYRLFIEEKLSPQKISDRLGFKGDTIVIQILKRKSLTGCIVYKGVEYPGQHEPIISLERWEEAQEEFESRSVVRKESNYLLTGLLVCGECGAKMRYQKWDKHTGECKLICYSQQKSKPALIKNKDCDNLKYWQSDIEDAVVKQLFEMKYLADNTKKTDTLFDPIAALNEELKKAERQLARLYDFDDDDGDEILKEKILNVRKKISDIKTQIESEYEQKKIRKKIENAKDILGTLKDTWPMMSQEQRQIVCKELIDRVIVYKNGTIDVHLKLKRYLINAESTASIG